MRELYKLNIDKKYGTWYYSYIEGRMTGDITYYLYDCNKRQVGKFLAYFQLKEAILSGDIKGYQDKNCYFGEHEICINGKLVTKTKESSLEI